MVDINYSNLLRSLVNDYFEARISRVEYLAGRRSILDRVDHEFNGEADVTQWPDADTTLPATPCDEITNVPQRSLRGEENKGGVAPIPSIEDSDFNFGEPAQNEQALGERRLGEEPLGEQTLGKQAPGEQTSGEDGQDFRSDIDDDQFD